MRIARVSIACGLACFWAATAGAEAIRRMDTAMRAYSGPPPGGALRAFTSAGFEESEGYSLGTCSANNGWRTFGASNPTPPGPRGPTTGVTKLQGNPGRSLLLDQNPNFPNDTNIGCFTPVFMNPFDNTLTLDVFVDDVQGANYFINPQAPTQSLSTARVVFSYAGNILVLDDLDGNGPDGLTYEDTGVNVDYAAWRTLQLKVNAAASQVEIWYGPDKDNLTNIYNAFMWGSSIIEEAVLFSDNFQNSGSGSLTGGPAGTYFDNVALKPEPATAGVIAIGALLLRRRANRRAPR